MAIIDGIIYSEPITLVSDGLLAVEALFFSIILYTKTKQTNTLYKRWPWIAMYLSTVVFAASGSISHGTNQIMIRNIFWSPVLIGGIFMLYFFQKACVFELSPKITDQPKLHKIYSYILMIGFQIFAYVMNWGFWVFGVYLLIIIGEILWRCRPSFKNLQSDFIQKFINQLQIYFSIIILLVVVQAIGSVIHWTVFFGAEYQFLLQPHNEIFHFGALAVNYYLFQALLKLNQA